MSQSIVGQNVSVGRHSDILQHQSQQNSINGKIIKNNIMYKSYCYN